MIGEMSIIRDKNSIVSGTQINLLIGLLCDEPYSGLVILRKNIFMGSFLVFQSKMLSITVLIFNTIENILIGEKNL